MGYGVWGMGYGVWGVRVNAGEQERIECQRGGEYELQEPKSVKTLRK